MDGGEEGGRAKEGGDGGEPGLKLVALEDEGRVLSLNFSAKGFHDVLILLILREVLRLHRVVELPPQPPILHVRPGRREPRLCDFLAHQSSQPARELHPEDLQTLCLRHRLREKKAAGCSTALAAVSHASATFSLTSPPNPPVSSTLRTSRLCASATASAKKRRRAAPQCALPRKPWKITKRCAQHRSRLFAHGGAQLSRVSKVSRDALCATSQPTLHAPWRVVANVIFFPPTAASPTEENLEGAGGVAVGNEVCEEG
eukprot:CAMPEP_0184735730 /NCGR_PEP_ID=MMETSP0314-20130426/62038_1 /TAXON_ID=38298 /ORGANISM="Rhodella maculata, Strain CCMP 736" /LENGTH=257 /DNA_ID=CAMNT_0027202779 /DNA_START=380 /DNA_END=1153 /DNA_ORIENTATION=-